MALKRQVDTLEDEKDTLQIKVSEQELHIIEQHDIIQDQVSEIAELNLHTEMQTRKILQLECEIKQLVENKEFFVKAQKALNDSDNKGSYISPKSSC